MLSVPNKKFLDGSNDWVKLKNLRKNDNISVAKRSGEVANRRNSPIKMLFYSFA